MSTSLQISTRADVQQVCDSLVVFADDWGRHPSSCQHLIRRLMNDHKILWVNTIGTRSPKANAFTLFRGVEKIKSWFRGTRQVSERMWVIDAPMLPYIGNAIARRVNRTLVTTVLKKAMKRVGIVSPTLITTLPMVSWLVGDIGQQHTVYYCTDDYSHWPEAERESLLAAERDLQAKSDLVLAVSDRLMERNRDVAERVFFPHAVDYDHFSAVSRIASHPEVIAAPAPRIGFFGLIYEKLDFDLLTRLAQHRPDATIFMIGPVDFRPDAFAELPNVRFLGKQPYEELPRWLAGLDLLLMPYVKDEMIQQSSPLKLKECLATGLPTVCVNLPEARKSEPHLRVAEDSEHFLTLVDELLATGRSVDACTARQAFVCNETWDARADELRQILAGLPRSTTASN